MSWVATCNFCGAPLLSGACPRCRYRRPEKSEPRKGQVVFTAADSQPSIPKELSIRLVLVEPVTTPGTTDTISRVELLPGESLLLLIFTNGTDLLSLPHISGTKPTWNGIDSSGTGTWCNPADITLDVYSAYYWNLPGTGEASIVVTYDPGDTATTRLYFVIALNTNDTSLSGDFDFPPNGSSDYMTEGVGTDTGAHTATTDFATNVVIGMCQLKQPESATAGTWQNGFTRLQRSGTTLGTANDLTGDVAYKFVPAALTTVGTRLSGFTSCEWGLLSFETELGT